MKVKEIAKSILFYVVMVGAVIALRHYVFSPVEAIGDSMKPTINDGERMFGLKLAEIERFDIVTFPAPDDPGRDYVKRVIGLPGDTVAYKNDQLYINGKKYEESYLDEFKGKLTDGQPLTNDFDLQSLFGYEKVPAGQLFVLGDNRRISKDGRIIGMIDEEAVLTNVKFVFWPPNRIGTVD
ncbi:signal peptidase I [Candidatus Enterococcus murrayae]|uniref:Signal peptidase I n=1 Tax=Candidatus Enterococcus murrayae TaxID=2815321 RepID=A0ABS3HM67_9ENTE|nr:signal peptidase I [Enterococcus sp. MJM16]MBO0454554.1 signal peptidase I [Enterococcus sp. MJM16]